MRKGAVIKTSNYGWDIIFEDGKKDIFNYIEMFYNRKRRHKTLGYVSPVVYEEMYEMKQERAA